MINNILNSMISYQANTWSNIDREITIETVLSKIKSDEYKNRIDELRNKLEKGNKEYYDNYKKQLPAVTFSAVFDNRRTIENLKTYNSVIVIDIDKLDVLELEKTYNNLFNDDYVYSFWRSPSNNGYKGLVAINYQFDCTGLNVEMLHKCAFKKLSEHFLREYNIVLDKSGSDITRLCFISHDINLVQKERISKFEVVAEDLLVSGDSKTKKGIQILSKNNLDALYNPSDENSQSDMIIMTDIIRFLTHKKISITNSYDEWCKVAMAISNAFTFEIGLNYFLELSLLDIDKYDKIKCINFLMNCYESRKGKINFGSIVYLAKQKGYKTIKQRNGVPKAEG